MSTNNNRSDEKMFDNQLAKEILWMLAEIEDVMDDQLNSEKRASLMSRIGGKIASVGKGASGRSEDGTKRKLEQRKASILEKITLLVKKRLGYDLDYSNSFFNSSADHEVKDLNVYPQIKEMCTKFQLPAEINEYIHLVIFSIISLKYLSDLAYIHRVNRGTIFRDREFKQNKFVYLRFKLHRFLLNYALLTYHPFLIRFNKLRATMKKEIDLKFYYINLKIDDYVNETKLICKRPCVNPKKLGEADQVDLNKFYDECRIYLEEHCCVWLEKFEVDVSGELCPESDLDEQEQTVIEFSASQSTSQAALLREDTVRLDDNSEQREKLDECPHHPSAVSPLFANIEDAEEQTRAWQILHGSPYPGGEMDTMSQTNSTLSEVFSDGLPSNSLEVQSTSGSESTQTDHSTDSYHIPRKLPRLY